MSDLPNIEDVNADFDAEYKKYKAEQAAPSNIALASSADGQGQKMDVPQRPPLSDDGIDELELPESGAGTIREFFEYEQNNEALRLIQQMDDDYPEDWDGTAIRDELRRLHEAHDWQYRMAADRLRRIEKLEAEREVLLTEVERLKGVGYDLIGQLMVLRATKQMTAAIDAARGEK